MICHEHEYAFSRFCGIRVCDDFGEGPASVTPEPGCTRPRGPKGK
jgi:hypothetical protein